MKDVLMAAFAAPLVWMTAGTATVLVIAAYERWKTYRGRRRVRAALNRETTRHIAALVPQQRAPTDPQPWWDFVPQRDGEN